MYLWRKIVPVSIVLAASLLLNACVATDSSLITRAEYDFKRHDYAQAFKKLWGPAHSGSARAQYALGYLYFYGLGTVRDQDLARVWFKHAADAHYRPAEQAYRQIMNTEFEQYVPLHSSKARPAYKYQRFYAGANKKRMVVK